jgi:nicotinamidase-related amidase
MAQKALLIIDVQKGLFARKIRIYHAEEMLANICLLAGQAHQVGVPVIYVQHTNSTMPQGTDGWMLHPRLQPLESDLFVYKERGSAFEMTVLNGLLHTLNIHELIITGLVTHGCIKAACLDAAKLGYSVTLVSDGNSTFNPKPVKILNETYEILTKEGIVLKQTKEINFQPQTDMDVIPDMHVKGD